MASSSLSSTQLKRQVAAVMYIRFRLGRSGHSRFGIRRVPAYCLRDWHLDVADAERIVCRPTLATAGRRMQWSLACLILLVIVFWEYGVPSHTSAWIAVWGLIALAVLPLVQVPIHRVTLVRGPDQDLLVSVYDSLDEMPLDVRARSEQILRKTRPKRRLDDR